MDWGELKRGLPNATGLTFQALQWRYVDEFVPGSLECGVYITGVTEESNPVTVRTKFNPFIYVKMPEEAESVEDFMEKKVYGNKRQVQVYLKGRRSYEISKMVVSYKEIFRRDLSAGCTGLIPKLFRYVMITFNSHCVANATARMISKAFKGYEIYEANIEPHIRLATQSNCETTGWITLDSDLVTYQFEGDTRHIMIHLSDWHGMRGLGTTNLAPFRVMSFDLECRSESGLFCNHAKPKDSIIQIGVTLSDKGYFLFNLGVCDDIPGCHVYRYENEKDLLTGFAKFFSVCDPDIIIGHNIYGFDFPYLISRAKYNGVWHLYRDLNRIPGLPAEERVIELKSKAYNANSWTLLDMPGRFTLDTLVHFKRDQANKLRSYSLNSVAKHFLSRSLGVNPLRCRGGSKRIWIKHANHGLAVGKFVNLSKVPTPKLVENAEGIREYTWNGWTYEQLHYKLHPIVEVVSDDEYAIEMETYCDSDSYGYVGGDGISVFESKNEIHFSEMNRAFNEQDSSVMAEVGKYCVQDTVLPLNLINSQCVISDLIEMSKVTWVPIDYLITRGQQIKVFCLLSKVAFEKGWAVPALKFQDKPTEEHEGYEGGVVFDPVVGLHTDPTATLDFASLYPSVMFDNKLCYGSLVRDAQYENLPGVNYLRGAENDLFATNVPSLLPEIIDGLLIARSRRKKDMENAETKEKRNTHNGAQLALKLTANSLYGFTGVDPKTAMLPCIQIARTTTKLGRDLTLFAKELAMAPATFKEVMKCTTHFPLNYVHTVRLSNGSVFHQRTSNLLKRTDSYEVYGTQGFARVKGFDEKFDLNIFDGKERLVQVKLAKGRIFDMQNYSCEIRYGDTDSIFTRYDTSHLSSHYDKFAYTTIVGAYTSNIITHRIRLNNPHVPYEKQRMDLEYEKSYKRLILFSKKRYGGLVGIFDPLNNPDQGKNPKCYDKFDSKGTAGTRRDFCVFVTEIYEKVMLELFNMSEYDKSKLIANGYNVVKDAMQDLLNMRVPLNKLCVSRTLNDEYKLRIKEKSKSKKVRFTFCFDNIVADDVVNLCVKKYEDQRDDWVVETKNTDGIAQTLSVRNISTSIRKVVSYDRITRRAGKVITLKEIIDPETEESQLKQVTAAHARLARIMNLRDSASAPVAGSRLNMMFYKPKNPKANQCERVEEFNYAKEHGIKPDVRYYLEKQFKNALRQILETAEHGSTDKLFNDAFARLDLHESRQPMLFETYQKEIILDGRMGNPKRKRRVKEKVQCANLKQFFIINTK